jgi:2,4-dienoyl-CoA reductase-like NADH-dependent reductase (Old Yellow Enzyme family)
LVVGLQLTHSGRWSRPDGTPRPRLAFHHPLLDARVPLDAALVLSDDDLDALVDTYIDAAVLAADAGFDFVDVKHCHGYLLHELLGAVDRDGAYGGSFEHRTAFLRRVVDGVRARAPGLAVGVRLSAYDLEPYEADDDGVGVPVTDATDGARYRFGLEESRLCRTFSDCTTAPRNGLISGCYPLDDFYKEMPERRELAAAKKATRKRTRR